MVIIQFNLYKNICLYKYGHNSGPSKSPDMILTAFYVNLSEKKDEMPPKACRPPKSDISKCAGYGLKKVRKKTRLIK